MRSSLIVTVLFCILFAPTVTWGQNPFAQANSEGERILGVEIHGNTRTKDDVILRELGFHRGDLYDADDVSDAWERLEQLDFIAYVDISEKRPTINDVILVVQVEEDDRFVWAPYAAYDRRFDMLLGLQLGFRNFRGWAEDLYVRSAWGDLHGYYAGWRNPWILGEARLGVRVDAHWERYNFVFHPLRLDDRAVSVSLWRDLPASLRAGTSYRFRRVEVKESIFGPAPDGASYDPSIALELQHDSRNFRFYPTQGVHAISSVRFSKIGRDDPYTLYDLHVAGFYRLPMVEIVAGRITLHTTGSDDVIPVYEQAFLGGPDNLRGVDFSSLRGDRTLLATAEMRRPLFLFPLRGGRTVGVGIHAFHDWGKAWQSASGFDSGALKRSWGAGIHLNLGTRNFRFEWAHTDDGDDVFVFEDQMTF